MFICDSDLEVFIRCITANLIVNALLCQLLQITCFPLAMKESIVIPLSFNVGADQAFTSRLNDIRYLS